MDELAAIWSNVYIGIYRERSLNTLLKRHKARKEVTFVASLGSVY